MRRMTYLVMALALVLGFTQCKKEQPLEPQGEQVRITLNVDKDDNGAKVDVTGRDVTFTSGDQIIVACQGQYIGTLTHNGTNFSGEIASPHEGSYLYFYFLGNKVPKTVAGNDLVVGDYECSVDISDQSSELPVISMAPSTDPYSSSVSSYSARLHNKCSLMKFNVTTNPAAYGAPIYITGMKNKVRVWFNRSDNSDAFEYSKEGEGIIKMKGVTTEGGETWAIVLQQSALVTGELGSAYTFGYKGCRPNLQQIWNTHYYDNNHPIDITTPDASRTINLGNVNEDTVIQDGYTVTGTLNDNYMISIADGATVTLSDAHINDNNNSKSRDLNCAGITCLGNATINLTGGSIINCYSTGYPGIQAGPSGKTLIIQGTGTLEARGGSNAAGIGGGSEISCGNISLLSGTISACGGQNGAGIGSGLGSTCGNIEIEGGEISAQGGDGAAGIGSGSGTGTDCGSISLYGGKITACGGQGGAGIGSGQGGSCGSIDIQGVIITATGGNGAAGIGSGSNGSCGSIEIEGGSINATGGEGAGNIGAGENGSCVSVTQGALSGLFSVSPTTKVRFSRGNLKSDDSFADYQWDSHAAYVNSNGWSTPSDDWYVLSPVEWTYLYENSTLGFATVNDIHGLIILPDNYSGSITKPYDPNNTTYNTYPWNDNIYSGDVWATMENDGVVFLPTRNGGDQGHYWSSSGCFYFGCQGTGGLYIGSGPWTTSIIPNSSQSLANVRLVRTN